MTSMNNFPAIMKQARVDLTANVSGRFSPPDWQSILKLAHEKFLALQATGLPDLKAWEQVILDYYGSHYWGFKPDYVARRDPNHKKSGFAKRLVIAVVLGMTLVKAAIYWLGLRYTRTGDPKDAYLFLTAMTLILAGFGYFLWASRDYQD